MPPASGEIGFGVYGVGKCAPAAAYTCLVDSVRNRAFKSALLRAAQGRLGTIARRPKTATRGHSRAAACELTLEWHPTPGLQSLMLSRLSAR